MKMFLIFILLCLGKDLRAESITFLGLTDPGDEISHALNESDYEKHLLETLVVTDATVDQYLVSNRIPKENRFRLSMIVLGIGGTGEIGLGPFKLGAGIRHRTYFKRSL